MPNPSIENRQKRQLVSAGHSLLHSIGDLDQLREVARGASLEITQLGPGTMRGTLAHIDLGMSSIHLNRFNLPARGRGSVSSSRWTIVVFPEDTAGTFNSINLDSGRLLLYPPNSEFEGTVTRPFQDWVFTVEHDYFAQQFQTLTQSSAESLPKCIKSFLPDPLILQQLRSIASRSLDQIESSLLDDHRFRESLNQQLTRLLVGAIFSARPDSNSPARRLVSHGAVFRCCEEYLRSNIDDSISIANLCLLSGVSERTLRNAFHNTVGLGPNAYIKALRLNRARTALRRSFRDVSTVTSVAMSCGFIHMGDFSRNYKQFFGESPSKTLRRGRSFV